MARVQPRTDVYSGMLILICAGMLVGILALVLEAGDYDWVQKSPTAPAVNLPKSEPLADPGAVPAGNTSAESTRGPVAAQSSPLAPRADGSDTARGGSGPPSPPAGLPTLPTAKAEAPKPEAPAGPTPSPLTVAFPGRPSLPTATGPTPSPLTIPPPATPARR